MKGPVVFLVSLVAVAAVGALVVRPLYRPAAPAPAPPEADAERQVRQAAERLRAAVAAPAAALADLESAWGPLLDRSASPPAATVELAWERLPALLVDLARPGHPAPAGVTVAPSPDAARCRVRLEFGAAAAPAGGR